MFNRLFRNSIFSFIVIIIAVQTQGQTLKVLPLGNSLTKGVNCINGTIYSCQSIADSDITGYRYALYTALLNAGYEIEFVGNELAGWSVFPSTDLARHAGYPGIRSDQLAGKLNENNNYLLNSTDPDIVLLEIGTNDILAGYTLPAYVSYVRNILNEIDEYETSSGKPILVFLSKIIKFTQGALYGENVATFNANLLTLYNQRVSAGDLIQWLDVGATLVNLKEPSGDMMDELHPNQGGYDKMAQQWFQTINSYNTAPVPSQIPNQQVQEGYDFSVISLDSYIYDAEDGDAQITWTLAEEPQHYIIEITTNRQVNITPIDENWNGSESITFVATDRGKTVAALKKSASISATFTVEPVNDPPVVSGQSRIPVVLEETPVTLAISDLLIEDVDNQPSDFSIQVLSGSNYTFSGNTVTPALNFNGELQVSIRVNDLQSPSQTFSFKISVTAKNDPPVINSGISINCNEDTPVKLRLIDFSVTDPDNYFPADFTLLIGNGQHYNHSGDTIIPNENFNGTLEIPVRVKDLLDQSNEFVQEITIVPVNDPPSLVLPVNNTIIEGNFFEYQVAAYDADIEQVNISAVSLPSWLSHNASDNKLSGTPTHQNIGNNQVILRLDDTHVTVDSTFILEVLLNTGIDDPENDNSMIYPNPASKYFHIKTNLVISGILSFRLYTTDGDVVISKHILQENETIYLDDYSLQPGIYIYEITDKNTMAFKGKLVVTPTAHEW